MYSVDTGDTAFILLCTALVCLMTPGLAFFYGGLVRRKNVLTIMMQSFISMGVIAVIWIFGGFSLAFGPDIGGLFGSISYHFALDKVGAAPSPDYATTVPFILFFAYQLMFAIITPALITGAFAGRFNFRGYLQFLILWMIFVYIPVCHWVWGGGFLARLGVVDFAGGIVVHVSAGFAALATVIFLGPRDDIAPGEKPEPNNLPLVAVGAGLLWFGWFGFNAGGAYAGDGLAAYAFTNTTISGSIAMLVWMMLDWRAERRPSFSGVLVGAVAGLATITPAAGYVPPWAAILIGAIGATVCYFAKCVQERFRFDDALEVWRAHGMGGVTGALLIGVFASRAINTVQASFEQFFLQLLGIVVVGAWSFAASWLILKVISRFGPIHVSREQELQGLDEALHGESAYRL
ncbi:ammonium transporter [Mailhella sp.]|uniref:ammonium transporter n=1 Tax=Mailhella sp. TaxID=1981029 RepID=UPI004064AC7F